MTEKEKLEYLEKNGIDTHIGLRYADESFSFYLQLISVFVEEFEEKKKKAEETAVSAKDEYAVLVHGLKNNARALGVTGLGDLAWEHEKAAKAGEKMYIKENLPILLSLWQETVRIFKKINN